jgi:archaellum biogenesis ATPase FlaH
LVQGLNEAISYEKGDIVLKSTTRSSNDFLTVFSQLPEEKKVILMTIANDMLIANAKA